MTPRLINRMAHTVAILGLCAMAWSVQAADGPLPSWNDGAARQAIVAFVEAVTAEGGADFVAPADRIAPFDNDGTLWVEHPLYTQAMFALDRVAALAPEHPEWKGQEPFKAVLAGDREDVLLLAQHFLDLLNLRHATSKRFADGTERTLLRHAWPGNVRELRSAVQRAYLASDGPTVRMWPSQRRMRPSDSGPDAIVFNVGMSYAEIEREMLTRTLAHFGNDRTRTAQALGVSVRTIHNQLARLKSGGDA